ncbi:MAG: hypothetical protein Q7T50_08170, partial [Candidatus Magasanikbacteria bacterium]|nr:hypothetical protein [Candidatus Magasanikbacteria bacterium]
MQKVFRNKNKKSWLTYLLVSVFALAFFVTSFSIRVPVVYAATKTATTTGNWSTLTWSPAGVPAAGDDVVIGNGVTVTVDSNITINSIHFFGASTGTPTTGILIVNSPNTLTVTGGIYTPSSAISTNHKANGTYDIQGTGTINCASLTM